ncbi:hypothetical protein, partial [Candidatus Thiosymbion oneisti]|uniref:hypothetical protein n=1 Tax=Candidatus Thiosymbion oneisti TaxID=589554 RepID=UPI001C401A69
NATRQTLSRRRRDLSPQTAPNHSGLFLTRQLLKPSYLSAAEGTTLLDPGQMNLQNSGRLERGSSD